MARWPPQQIPPLNFLDIDTQIFKLICTEDSYMMDPDTSVWIFFCFVLLSQMAIHWIQTQVVFVFKCYLLKIAIQDLDTEIAIY